MPNNSSSAPSLLKLSQFESPAVYSFTGRWKARNYTRNVPAANKYDCRELVNATSKYPKRSNAVAFSTASRFGDDKRTKSLKSLGPGQYDTHLSTLGAKTCSVGRSTRTDFTKLGSKAPGPGTYDVIGKDRRMEDTLAKNAPAVAGRHGWYYENKQAELIPGPGKYEPSYGQLEEKYVVDSKFGTSLRPDISSLSGARKDMVLGPGSYQPDKSTTVCYSTSPAFSFTNSNTVGKLKKKHDPPMMAAPTAMKV